MKKCILLLILVCAGYISVEACSCLGQSSVKASLKSADAVFVGEVVSAKKVAMSQGNGITFYRMVYQLVKKTRYKGRIKSDTISVITGTGGGDCGFPFEIGKQYVVYASRIKKNELGVRLATNICTRTAPATEEEMTALRRYSWWRL